jgi:hypothetical protein
MKRFLLVLFVVILTVSMILAGVGCKKTDNTAATQVTSAETTDTETATAQAASAETTAATPGTTAAASDKLDLGEATVKDPDPEMMIESEVLGSVPANQVGIILDEGLTKTDAQKIADELGASIVGEIEFINFYQLETQDTTEAQLLDSLDKAAETEGVDLAFSNGAIFSQSTVEGSSCSPLNDPLYTEGSNARPYEMIGVQNAWDIIKASGVKLNKVRVGIIDTALYTESDNGFSQELYLPDENGKYPEGKAQIMTLDEDNDLTYLPETNPKTGDLIDGGLSHCTQMAHIVGADPNGGGAVGVTSIAGENVSITVTNALNTFTAIPAQNIDPNDITQYQGNTYTLLVNLKKQVENNVKVINLSLGPDEPSAANAAVCQAYKRFFEKMSKDHPDVVFVAAAGNENGALDGSNYGPGGISLPNVITVGALDQDGDRATIDDWYKAEDIQKEYQKRLAAGRIPANMTLQAWKESLPAGSNYATGNGEVTLSAVGTGVPVGLDPDGKSVISNGTSLAAPQVTGAIALLQSINPNLSAAEIKKILVESAASEVERDGKKVTVPANMGGGILRVDKAVLMVLNDMRKAQDKNAVNLKIEDMLAMTSIKITASGGPKDYTITATVSEVGSSGIDIRIETIGEGELKGNTTQSISAPGQVSWTLTKESDDYFIKVFRSDTGDCAFLTLGKEEQAEENLIHGVVPMQVTATMSGKTGKGTFYFTYEFWNVGELGGAQYSAVTCTGYFSENDSTDVSTGTFTGGPNGDIYIQGSTMVIHLKVHDGITITNQGGDSFSIDNPGAFDGWID